MTKKDYTAQLNRLLDALVREYDLTLASPEWRTMLLHDRVHTLLVDHQLLVIVANKPHDDLLAAYEECRANITALYDFLVRKLFASVATQALESHCYDAGDFLVLVFSGPAAMVLEAIGTVVLPFVRETYQQALEDHRQNLQVADSVLKMLYVEQPDTQLQAGIIERIDPLRIQRLQLLPLVNGERPATIEPIPTPADEPPTAPPGNNHVDPIDLILIGRNQPRRRTAPLPDYFRHDDAEK